MLQKLSIYNYAIIDELVIDFSNGLTTMTGETGAGKSIILGALSLILGERADTSVLINKEKKCIVEAVFDVKGNEAFKKLIDEEELDHESQCIIRREISTSGKSRAFVNDSPVRLNVLNKLTALLVDLHQQFDQLALDDNNFQLDVVDAIAANGKFLSSYKEQYKKYKQLQSKLNTLVTQKDELQKDADYKQYLFNELEEASFKPNEIEDAEQQLKQLSNAEKITNIYQEALHSLDTGERPLLDDLKRLCSNFEDVANLVPEAKAVLERLNSVHIELRDVTNEIDDLAGKVSMDEELLATLEERMDIGYKLLKKHNVQTTDELLEIQTNLEKELQSSVDLDADIGKLEHELNVATKAVADAGAELSKSRAGVTNGFMKQVNELLALIGMPNAIFSVEVNKLDAPQSTGLDEVAFYLDANKSGSKVPVYKAASGGELSRIMLAIKSLTAKALHLPTLIFDEVDTGISGEAAKQVAILLNKLGKYHQIICITHQPQVAAKGDNHIFVYKEPDTKGQIKTKVRSLNSEERITAVAKMIGGEEPGAAAIQNAKEIFAN